VGYKTLLTQLSSLRLDSYCLFLIHYARTQTVTYNNNNNNLHLILVKTNRSTLHMQKSATQGSNDTTHRLSRRTAATTRFSPEGIGCQK